MDMQKLILNAAEVEAVPLKIPGASGEFKVQILNEDQDAGVVTTIIHLPAGGTIPAHSHKAGAEMHYVLEGELIEAGTPYPAGSFLTFAPGVVHGPHESKQPAKVLTVQQWQSKGGQFDFEPAEGGSSAGSSDAKPAGSGAQAAAEGSPVEGSGAAEREHYEGKGYT
ncbi:cupin domain-containing protein [Roseomonas elaeocarpi]|uniref:Cupin domain-containing protein n=1 Tax=Roseomonas elaeocarpi TaxID=907779 RepID=A0ABV6JPW3_9PROT